VVTVIKCVTQVYKFQDVASAAAAAANEMLLLVSSQLVRRQ
jgi:hypothetical protein